MLVLSIAEDFDELLQDGCLTAIAPLCKLGRIVIMAVHAALVLVVTVGSSEYGGTDGTREMLDVVLSVQRRDIGAAESLATIETQ